MRSARLSAGIRTRVPVGSTKPSREGQRDAASPRARLFPRGLWQRNADRPAATGTPRCRTDSLAGLHARGLDADRGAGAVHAPTRHVVRRDLLYRPRARPHQHEDAADPRLARRPASRSGARVGGLQRLPVGTDAHPARCGLRVTPPEVTAADRVLSLALAAELSAWWGVNNEPKALAAIDSAFAAVRADGYAAGAHAHVEHDRCERCYAAGQETSRAGIMRGSRR